MTAFGMFLVLVGALIIVSRGPLVVAPEATRRLYMKLLKNGRAMRAWGAFAAALGAASVAVSRTPAAEGIPGAIALWVGLAVAILGLIAAVALPEPLRRIGERVWGGWGAGKLRAIGGLSAAVGAALIYYGLRI